MDSPNKTVLLIIAGAIILLGSIYYLFYFEPQQTKKKCYELSKPSKSSFGSVIDIRKFNFGAESADIYEDCLRKNGL